jgi:hypothetical protein
MPNILRGTAIMPTCVLDGIHNKNKGRSAQRKEGNSIGQ